MIHKTAKKIHQHRVSFLIVISLMFLTYLGLNPVDLGKYYGARFGSAVGMSVGVEQNPINKVAQQLKEKEGRLVDWENRLDSREKELDSQPSRERLLITSMAVGILVLFVLILLNFYLDRRHLKQNQ